MRNLFLFLPFLLLHCHTVFPQRGVKQIDSLEDLISSSPNDTLKVLRLLTLAQIQTGDTATATFVFAERAKTLAETLHYKRGIALALQTIASVYQIKKDFASAIKYYQLAIEAGETYTHHNAEDDFYPALLNLYFYLGDYPNAMKASAKALEQALKKGDRKRIARCNNLFGYIYYKQGNIEASKKYYNNYIKMAGELKDSFMLAHAFSEVSEVLMEEKKYPSALEHLNGARSIYTQLIQKNKQAFNANVGSSARALLTNTLHKTGKAYKYVGDHHTALKYALAALDSARNAPCNTYELAGYHINAGDIYKELRDHEKATSHLLYGLGIAHNIRHRETMRDAYNYLSQAYELQKQYDSAYLFYRLYTAIKDSIVNHETSRKISEMEAKYEMEKKNKEIEKQQLASRIMIIVFIFFALTLLLLYNRFRLKQKNKHQQEMSRQRNEMFNTIINVQDKERKRIAQDIHDSLGSVLAVAKLKLSGMEDDRCRNIMALLDEAVSELRSISHNIMPATLSKLGLTVALEQFFQTISSYQGLSCHYSAHGLDERLDEETEMNVYRIVLELSNNVVKHAQAGKLTVQLVRHPGHINIIVEDDGKGFDPHNLPRSGGIGLSNVLSRVEFMNGKIDIDSGNSGTTVMIDIPVQ